MAAWIDGGPLLPNERSHSRKQKGGDPAQRVEPRPLFGSDDKARIQRGRGIDFLRQLQERTDVIPPFLAAAFHQFPDRLANLSDIIETINGICLQTDPPDVGYLFPEPPPLVPHHQGSVVMGTTHPFPRYEYLMHKLRMNYADGWSRRNLLKQNMIHLSGITFGE